VKQAYRRVFVEEWSPYAGAVLLVGVILVLMLNGLFWGIFGGLKLWGDWLNQAIGLAPLIGGPEKLDSPLLHRMSLMNLALVLGAFSAALISRQFTLNRPPKLEYAWAALGGALMGAGATLAGGCTTGGFFTPLLHSSPAGWAMGLGLLVGAALGLKLLLWTLENIQWGMQAPPAWSSGRYERFLPGAGFIVILGVLLWAARWAVSEDERLAARSLIIAAGLAMGFIMHRSRLCFARAFREPFMTGGGEMTKAILLAAALGIPLAALLFRMKAIDPYIAIPPTFWIGSLAGGLLFGIGMIFAGGCASGALWRMGEGHLKLWVAAFFFAWVGSVASAVLKGAGWLQAEMNLELIEETRLGYQAYFPAMLEGWTPTFALAGIALLVWYLLVRYNERSQRFTLI
jgi:uncharacterized membrane protein YedE/YeeE